MSNLLADQKGALLTERETVYWIDKGMPFKVGTAFNAGEVLNKMTQVGIIKEYSNYNKHKGRAREAIICQKKNISKFIETIVSYYLDNGLSSIVIDFFGLDEQGKEYKDFEAASEGIHSKPLSAQDRQRKLSLYLIAKFKQRQEKDGISIILIKDYIEAICPGYQPKRKEVVLGRLLNKYELITKTIGFITPKKGITKSGEIGAGLENECIDVLGNTPIHNKTLDQTSNSDTGSKSAKSIARSEARRKYAERRKQKKLAKEQTKEQQRQDNLRRLGGLNNQENSPESVNCIDVLGNTPIHNNDKVQKGDSLDSNSSSVSISDEVKTGLAFGLMETELSTVTSDDLTSLSSVSLPVPNSLVSNALDSTDLSSTSVTLPKTSPTTTTFTLSDLNYVPDFSSDSVVDSLDKLDKGDRSLLTCVKDLFDLSTINRKDLSSKCNELRTIASKRFHKEYELFSHSYNQAIAANLLRYEPFDIIDVRQKAVMAEQGPLPQEYLLCSPNSPRVYSKEVDNLFYCRKKMRVAAFDNLGFQDVDISGCHVQVALGLWGEHLPLLEQHVANSSLWKHYESIFNEKGLTFHKDLIKAMHHATLLGGGIKAYTEALRIYNKRNLNQISKEEFDNIVQVFKLTDIYKELKALFRYLDKTLHNTTVTVLTGEKFYVKGYRKYKDKTTGNIRVDEGNLLTVISAILQSFEVAMLSYLILRANQLFVPILWQHDGLTIRALYSNTVELMQEALDEFTIPLLGRSFTLESTSL
jgi:hypothetical protein